jgi:two-component system, OmpR family, response regulator
MRPATAPSSNNMNPSITAIMEGKDGPSLFSEARIGLLAGETILLADDDFTVRESLKILLKLQRCQVVEADNGVEALEKYRTGNFLCVVTDNLMPRLEGPELCAKIREINPAQHIVMVTASLNLPTSRNKPWNTTLIKPFAIEQFMTAILAAKLPAANLH